MEEVELRKCGSAIPITPMERVPLTDSRIVQSAFFSFESPTLAISFCHKIISDNIPGLVPPGPDGMFLHLALVRREFPLVFKSNTRQVKLAISPSLKFGQEVKVLWMGSYNNPVS